VGPGWDTGERGERARAAGLVDRAGGGWGRARRRGSARGAEVGADRAHGARVLDGGDGAQPAATAGAGQDVESNTWRISAAQVQAREVPSARCGLVSTSWAFGSGAEGVGGPL